MARSTTFKDWKQTGGTEAQFKDMIDIAQKNKKKYMMLSLIPWVGAIIWGWKGINCMDTIPVLQGKEPKKFSFYRLWIRIQSFFISFLLERIGTRSQDSIIKILGIEEFKHLIA